jgi:hypothetical protein
LFRAYLKLKAELSRQKKKDLNEFGGLFDRGSIVEPAELQQERSGDSQSSRPSSMSVEEGLRSIKDMESVAERYYRDGRLEESRQMAQRAAQLKAEIEAFAASASAAGPVSRRGGEDRDNGSFCGSNKGGPLPSLDWANLDFSHPTPEMVSTAKEAGLDLTDPR